jgi:DNA (cytosine-5)-methyltransferase 1
MRFLSICSGIEAASVAWAPLGWKAAAFAEIDAFPSAVLAHHYPDVPNLGDMTKFKEWPDYAVDLVCGGTPCQAFSVAGLRQGLADPRGNLALTFLAIVDRYRPEWVVWENVPGVLSANGGRDFAAFLGGLGHLGYGWCYRVLDAQYVRVDGFGRAVPQRRRRVFVVGYLGDWRRAAAVLSEPDGLLGDTPPRREAGEDLAGTLDASLGRRRGSGMNPVQIATVAPTLDASYGRLHGASNQDLNHGHGLLVEHTLRGEGFDASEDGTGRGTPLVPVVAQTLRARDGSKGVDSDCTDTVLPIAFNGRQDPDVTGDRAGALNGMSPQDQCVATGWAVRRLTPTECERLQGFPDGYTAVPYRGKPAADGPRYKALGNSWAVNCARWIGRRIELVEEVSAEIAAGVAAE